MSAIQEYLNDILTAVYGVEVRDSIYNSILQCYTDVTNAETLANTAAEDANTAASRPLFISLVPRPYIFPSAIDCR